MRRANEIKPYRKVREEGEKASVQFDDVSEYT